MKSPCENSPTLVIIITCPSLLTWFVCRSLSSHALAALAEFHAEKDAHEKTFEKLRTGAAPRTGAGLGVVEPEDEDPITEDVDSEPLSMAAFTEDWNESQFWVRKQDVENKARDESEAQLHFTFGYGGGDNFSVGFWEPVRVMSWGSYYVLAWYRYSWRKGPTTTS
jgi:hypothetical protein